MGFYEDFEKKKHNREKLSNIKRDTINKLPTLLTNDYFYYEKDLTVLDRYTGNENKGKVVVSIKECKFRDDKEVDKILSDYRKLEDELASIYQYTGALNDVAISYIDSKYTSIKLTVLVDNTRETKTLTYDGLLVDEYFIGSEASIIFETLDKETSELLKNNGFNIISVGKYHPLEKEEFKILKEKN